MLDEKWDVLFRHVIRTEETPDQFFNVLFRRLATGIFVRESRWTWVKEQQARLNFASDAVIESEPETVRDFLLAYNSAIDYLVNFSHFGASSNIQQADTAQEKHYFQ